MVSFVVNLCSVFFSACGRLVCHVYAWGFKFKVRCTKPLSLILSYLEKGCPFKDQLICRQSKQSPEDWAWTVDLKIMRSKHMKGWKECYLLEEEKKKKRCTFLGQSSLSSYKITLKQQLNGDKWDTELGHICFWLSYASFCVQRLEECSSCI